jgi:FtsZ-binding cell division protein ZapB
MDTLHLTAEEIKLKVVKLLQTVTLLEKRCEALQNENLSLKNELESQKNSIKALAETNKMLNIAEILHQRDEKRDLKKLVNAYIKEIDECIRLLSNK